MELHFATKSLELIQRWFQGEYPGKKIPLRHTITHLVNKFRDIGSVANTNKGHSDPKFTAMTPARVQDVRNSWNSRPTSPPESDATNYSQHFEPTKFRFFKCKLNPTRVNAIVLVRGYFNVLKIILNFWTFFFSAMRPILIWMRSKNYMFGGKINPMSMWKDIKCNKNIFCLFFF